jgi:hypothetical protein
VEVQMKIGMGKGVEVVGEAGWWLQDTDNLLIGPAGNHVQNALLHPKHSNCVDVVAVNLCPRDLVVMACAVFCDNPGGLVFGYTHQVLSAAVPLDI